MTFIPEQFDPLYPRSRIVVAFIETLGTFRRHAAHRICSASASALLVEATRRGASRASRLSAAHEVP